MKLLMRRSTSSTSESAIHVSSVLFSAQRLMFMIPKGPKSYFVDLDTRNGFSSGMPRSGH